MGASGRVGESSRSRLCHVACEEVGGQEAKKITKIFSRFFDGAWSRGRVRVPRKLSGRKIRPGRLPTTKSGSCGTCQTWQLGRSGRESTGTAHAVGSAGRTRLKKRAGACEKIRRAGLSTGPREVACGAGRFFRLSRRTFPRRPTSESPHASARRASGLARVPRVRAHAPWSIGPVCVNRTDAWARLRASEHERWAVAECTRTDALERRRDPQRRRSRVRGCRMSRRNGCAHQLAASSPAPSSGCTPPCCRHQA